MSFRRRRRFFFAAIPGGGGGGGPFAANAVNFDGTNDYLTRGAGLTGASDTGQITVSLWFKSGANTTARHFLDAPTNIFRLAIDPANKVACDFRSAVPAAVMQFGTTETFTVAGGWYNILFSYTSATQTLHVYIDDVASTLDFSIKNTGNIDWTQAGLLFGALTDFSQKMNGDIAEVWINNTYLDLSVEANRRKFIDASSKPVDLGSDGSTPTGAAPLVFFSGPTVDWHTNKGGGGGFTEVGALTDASSSPSD